MKVSQLGDAAAALVLAVLAGHVTDATTGQPLAHVTIAIGPHRTTTDGRGAYRLSGLQAGRYTLWASSKDVPQQHRSVLVRGAKTTLNLVLCSMTLDYTCSGAGPG